jgi:hypothetical protein
VNATVWEAEYVIARLRFHPRDQEELERLMATGIARLLVTECRTRRLWRSLPWWMRAWLKVTGWLLPAPPA